MPDALLEWGIEVILWLQSLGPGLAGPMNLVSFTGNIEFYLLILPVLYWSFDQRLAIRLGISLMLSIGLNFLLKLAWHEPRPYWVDERVQLWSGPSVSFGLPSGHAQNAVVLGGIVAAYGRTWWGWLAVLLWIGLIGLSRMVLGVHFPSDVVVGWAIGLGLLLLVLRLEPVWLPRFFQMPAGRQVAVVFILSLLIIICGAGLTGLISQSWRVPAQWPTIALRAGPHTGFEPFALEELIVSAGALFGLGSGAILLQRRGGFDPAGAWSQHLGRYVLGVVGVLLLWRGLGALFDLLAIDESLLDHLLRYIRYGLIGVWVSAGGPFLFIRLGLAKKREVQDW